MAFSGDPNCPHELAPASVARGVRQLHEGERPTHISGCVRCGGMVATIKDLELLVSDPLAHYESDDSNEF